MRAHEISDRDLVNSFLEGNQASIELLIEKHKRKVFAYIIILVKDKSLAEDIFQDTFIKVINTLKTGSYNDEGKFLPWVMRIAHNLSIDYFRKATRIPTVENREDYDVFNTIKIYDDSIEDKMINEQILKDVKRLIDFLPSDQREVLIMRHYQNMSFKDIAQQTNVSINTALGRMRYAIINMRKLIKKKHIILEM